MERWQNWVTAAKSCVTSRQVMPLARSRHQCAAKHLQQGALAGAIGPDDADALAPADFEAEVLESPEVGVSLDLAQRHPFQKAGRRPHVQFVALGEVLRSDQHLAHI